MDRLDDLAGELEADAGPAEARGASGGELQAAGGRDPQPAAAPSVCALGGRRATRWTRPRRRPARPPAPWRPPPAMSPPRTIAAAEAEEAIGPCATRRQVAGAVLHRLAIENDRLEREAAQAAAQVARLTAERLRVAADRERELHIVDDAAAALERLDAEPAQVEASRGRPRTPARADRGRPRRRQRARRGRGRGRAPGRRSWPPRTPNAARPRPGSSRSPAPARPHHAGAGAGQGRPRRPGRAVDPRAAEAQGRFAAALQRPARRRARPWKPPRPSGAAAGAAEAQARKAVREAEDQLGRLKTEARGLAQLTAPSAKSAFAPALDQVSPERQAMRPPWRRPWAMT